MVLVRIFPTRIETVLLIVWDIFRRLGRKFKRSLAEVMVRHMIIQGVLGEDAYFVGAYGTITVKVKVHSRLSFCTS